MTCDHKLTNHNVNQFQPITAVHSQITTCEVKGYVTTVGDKLSVLAGFKKMTPNSDLQFMSGNLKKMTPNSDLQFINKKFHDNCIIAKCQTVATLAPV